MYAFVNVHCKTKFFVFNDYEILESNQDSQMISATKQAMDSFYKEKEFKYSYNPLLDTPELYLELAKITNNRTLIKFVKNYGLPFETKKIRYIDFYKMIFTSLDMEEFDSQLETYKIILDIWNSIISKNQEELNKIKSKFNEIANFFQIKSQINMVDDYIDSRNLEDDEIINDSLKYNEKTEHDLWEKWKQIKEGDLETIAKTFVVYLLNSNQAGRNQFDVIDGQVKPAIQFSNLFEVAYYQLSQAMVNDIELKHCNHCYSLFEPKHGNQRFCSPNQPNMYKGKNKKRSSCENAYNQKLKRQRRKEKQSSIS